MEEITRDSIIRPNSAGNPFNEEFEELKKQLVNIKASKLNGISVFDPVATCGNIKDIDASKTPLNYTSANKESDVAATIRGMSIDVGAYGGELSFDVNSGETGEIYRVFMGDKQVFPRGHLSGRPK